MKVLITGAAGFVGSHLAKSLLRDGHAVRGFIRPTKDTSALEQLGVEFARGELNEKGWRNQFKEVGQISMIPVSRKDRNLEGESGQNIPSRKNVMHAKTPRFSIVIPTYNRPEQLAVCLQAIDRVTYPRDDFEVIVVDDGSQTLLDPIVNRFSDRMVVKLIPQPNLRPAHARNRGAAEAQCVFLHFRMMTVSRHRTG